MKLFDGKSVSGVWDPLGRHPRLEMFERVRALGKHETGLGGESFERGLSQIRGECFVKSDLRDRARERGGFAAVAAGTGRGVSRQSERNAAAGRGRPRSGARRAGLGSRSQCEHVTRSRARQLGEGDRKRGAPVEAAPGRHGSDAHRRARRWRRALAWVPQAGNVLIGDRHCRSRRAQGAFFRACPTHR